MEWERNKSLCRKEYWSRDVKAIMCSKCNTRQGVSNTCTNPECSIQFGHRFCELCQIQDTEKKQHCWKCGTCCLTVHECKNRFAIFDKISKLIPTPLLRFTIQDHARAGDAGWRDEFKRVRGEEIESYLATVTPHLYVPECVTLLSNKSVAKNAYDYHRGNPHSILSDDERYMLHYEWKKSEQEFADYMEGRKVTCNADFMSGVTDEPLNPYYGLVIGVLQLVLTGYVGLFIINEFDNVYTTSQSLNQKIFLAMVIAPPIILKWFKESRKRKGLLRDHNELANSFSEVLESVDGLLELLTSCVVALICIKSETSYDVLTNATALIIISELEDVWFAAIPDMYTFPTRYDSNLYKIATGYLQYWDKLKEIDVMPNPYNPCDLPIIVLGAKQRKTTFLASFKASFARFFGNLFCATCALSCYALVGGFIAIITMMIVLGVMGGSTTVIVVEESAECFHDLIECVRKQFSKESNLTAIFDFCIQCEALASNVSIPIASGPPFDPYWHTGSDDRVVYKITMNDMVCFKQDFCNYRYDNKYGKIDF
jgi:hypothetical protein